MPPPKKQVASAATFPEMWNGGTQASHTDLQGKINLWSNKSGKYCVFYLLLGDHQAQQHMNGSDKSYRMESNGLLNRCCFLNVHENTFVCLACQATSPPTPSPLRGVLLWKEND